MRYNMADDSATDALPGGEKTDPATVFGALAEIIYQGSDANEMYAAICIAATLIVPGCDHASLLVRQNDRYVTVGASDRMAERIDDFERRAGDGPCIDAIEEETPQIETDLTTPNQWPKLAAILLKETPVRGAMGFRILVDKRKGAALNLFSRTPEPVQHRVSRPGGRAGIVHQRRHQRDCQGRRCHHPSTRAAQQPRDRQGHRHADDAE